ncbi:hypothetical protein COW80_02570 [Candidatus Beckwithbacteria bacterium CG22_combo_CG10-13_8_21_14_all_01_47_9]|uniref:Uncharacterized protein n=5 Tax=Candidatus Beckwithiibacteriota TaxID=1752726 RepID=A0A2H0E0T2_9BACT|nr:MAG: hypothetical protein AUJ59_01905 [Candidatus Beckwithbacteria bacterium CG1_02_47_37]PIP52024.1 MAG: hypothetical protein COX09_03760 [Candidatus Beckwithbacteria bacterium CG23_combo_of_CG06-09_8_20_14_all_47_9]PIP88032.1 MAG: hypothetical protein COW80_02570 [Candidatus Beckwithbacteria bacterium CG22_combo_CG10-13_8_21_14_all_01_47_9]PJA21381.1 MAG: hypothetical protein COX59_04360 [Candidatus Beckwithbacteria bacterium CG_4_10_14_0_2_um_filter_47_25]PJC66449.1 MAG: hypothetical prot
MLNRRYRLPGYFLPRTLTGRIIFFDNDLIIRARANNLTFTRWAIIVPKRVFAKAVKRNRLKRRLLAAIDPAKITPGWDVAVLIKK